MLFYAYAFGECLLIYEKSQQMLFKINENYPLCRKKSFCALRPMCTNLLLEAGVQYPRLKLNFRFHVWYAECSLLVNHLLWVWSVSLGLFICSSKWGVCLLWILSDEAQRTGWNCPWNMGCHVSRKKGKLVTLAADFIIFNSLSSACHSPIVTPNLHTCGIRPHIKIQYYVLSSHLVKPREPCIGEAQAPPSPYSVPTGKLPQPNGPYHGEQAQLLLTRELGVQFPASPYIIQTRPSHATMGTRGTSPSCHYKACLLQPLLVPPAPEYSLTWPSKAGSSSSGLWLTSCCSFHLSSVLCSVSGHPHSLGWDSLPHQQDA